MPLSLRQNNRLFVETQAWCVLLSMIHSLFLPSMALKLLCGQTFPWVASSQKSAQRLTINYEKLALA